MIRLTETLNAWNTPEFESVLKRELEQLDARVLPLQQGLVHGSHVSDDPFGVMVIGVVEKPDRLCSKVGIFYTGIIAGCNCADDPTPVDGRAEYCEVLVAIDKATADATLSLFADP